MLAPNLVCQSVLYTSDQGGNELNHVYVQDADSNVTDLTPGEGLKASTAGRKFAII